MSEFIIRDGNKEEEKFILKKLVEYNLSQVPLVQEVDYVWINKVVENDKNEIIAGISGKMYCWNCLYVELLWVREDCRKCGLGSKLLELVEEMVKKQGCYLVHLDTFDFQGRDFYLKHGYEVFGVLDDCPMEHKRYYLKKIIKIDT